MKFINWFFKLITFGHFIARRRRRRYEELKKLIVEEHLNGKGGIMIPRKFGKKDLQSFKAPMYHFARKDSANGPLCIFWRKDLMTEEIGAPLSERKPIPSDLMLASAGDESH